MKKFLFIITVTVFPLISFADIASTKYVDERVPAATRETAGVAKMGEIPVGTSGTQSAMMWIE